jgi:hypothetical protein
MALAPPTLRPVSRPGGTAARHTPHAHRSLSADESGRNASTPVNDGADAGDARLLGVPQLQAQPSPGRKSISVTEPRAPRSLAALALEEPGHRRLPAHHAPNPTVAAAPPAVAHPASAPSAPQSRAASAATEDSPPPVRP